MRVIITGSTGFVGRHLVPALVVRGHDILEVTRDIEKSTGYFASATEKYLLTSEQDELAAAIIAFKPDACIHLAAYLTSADDYQSMLKLLESNVVYFSRVLDALKGSGVKVVINTGTCTEYFKSNEQFDPAYLYAATKTASRSILEYYAKTYSFKAITLVPYTIYGGRDSQKKIIDIIRDSISTSIPVDLSPGEQKLDFIHIDDVVSCYIKTVENYEEIPTGTVIHVGTGISTSLRELAAMIETITGKKTNVNWGGKAYRVNDIMYASADTKKMDWLWKPEINLFDGIKLYIGGKF